MHWDSKTGSSRVAGNWRLEMYSEEESLLIFLVLTLTPRHPFLATDQGQDAEPDGPLLWASMAFLMFLYKVWQTSSYKKQQNILIYCWQKCQFNIHYNNP